MSTDGRAIATHCETNSGEYSSFAAHPMSGCNSSNFWPTEKCSTPPPAGAIPFLIGDGPRRGSVERVVAERNVTDMSGRGPYTRIEHLAEALGYDSPRLAWSDGGASYTDRFWLAGNGVVAGLLYPVLAGVVSYMGPLGVDTLTATLYGSGWDNIYGPWIWNPYINMWVVENSDLNPRAVVRCSSGSEMALEASVMSEEEMEVLADILDDHYADMYGHPYWSLDDSTTKAWSKVQGASYGERFRQTVITDLKHSWTSQAGLIDNLDSNFMTISREPYTTAEGDEFYVYGSISDFVAPSVPVIDTSYGYSFGVTPAYEASEFLGATDGESFMGKKFDITYSEQEQAGLRYLFGFPAEYTGNSRRINYINDKLDAIAESILLSDLIYSFTYNRKRTPILSRNSFEAYPAQPIGVTGVTINNMTAAAITPSESSTGTMRDALAAALARLRPMKTDMGEDYDYSSLSDADLAGADYVAIGSLGTSAGMAGGGGGGGGTGY